MTTLTDKELIKEIKERIGSLDVRDNIERRAYEIALASLEAEPVAVNDDMAYAFHHALSDSSLGADEVEEIKAGLRAAFANVTIQPEPVVPDEIVLAIETLKQKLVECNRYNYCADAVKGVEDACHAAMLHGAEPVSQTYKSQHTQFEQVADLYEMQFDDGRTCAFHTDAQKAAQWLQACDGNRVQEYVKLERLRNALSGNYPVTPDGWISCSERMPEDTKMLLAFSQGEIVAAYWNWVVNPIDYKKYRAFTYLSGNILDDVTHWMPLPEPPQEEVNRG
ncbi:DUF551 domain-containing protein [Escherichia coli]|nr:DUF551 domain-containing protein [Escherichia coli]EHK1118623.1 DUF551 domain-containing protein [Escherichia coli]EHK6412890.1 DUF551 domain-containing protein [Escherichia coli]EHK6417651.1 DUF551 domain-containing protein [Escherichia coli]EHK7144143.1 DUF551 domain-containing protein [Escherichia coli]